MAGERHQPHVPADRRRLLPISPAERPSAVVTRRTRLTTGPTANLKLAEGCDRRCTFCGTPTTNRVTPGGDAMTETTTTPQPVCGEHIERVI